MATWLRRPIIWTSRVFPSLISPAADLR